MGQSVTKAISVQQDESKAVSSNGISPAEERVRAKERIRELQDLDAAVMARTLTELETLFGRNGDKCLYVGAQYAARLTEILKRVNLLQRVHTHQLEQVYHRVMEWALQTSAVASVQDDVVSNDLAVVSGLLNKLHDRLF